MNRRDIIITAVLINSGLLIVLFISSLKPLDHEATPIVKKEEVVKKVEPIRPAKAPKAAQVARRAPAKKAPVKKVEVAKVETPKVQKFDGEVIEVQPGDALEKIAKRHNVSVDGIMTLNKMEDTRLKVGQKLQLPKEKLPREVKVEPKVDVAEYYVVKNGDNPWTIAVKNHIKVDDLLKLNGLDESKARRLKPGDKLRIR